jgi:hypothetical protein
MFVLPALMAGVLNSVVGGGGVILQHSTPRGTPSTGLVTTPPQLPAASVPKRALVLPGHSAVEQDGTPHTAPQHSGSEPYPDAAGHPLSSE